MNFDFENNIPIYIQLVEQLKKCIISGDLESGQRLPSVRDLALETKVNPNTMQKALAKLEELKLICTKRTSGKYVTDDKTLIDQYKYDYARRLSNYYIESMKSIGFTLNEIKQYLEEIGGRK